MLRQTDPQRALNAFRPKSGWARRMSHARWRLRRFAERVLVWIIIGLGMVFLGVGFVFALLPGHIGLPVMVLGLIMVLRNAYWARRQFMILKRMHPNWVMPIRKLLRKRPPVASVLWQQVLKMERNVLRLLRLRVWLAQWRRRVLRRQRHCRV